jgi:hypothetical protein
MTTVSTKPSHYLPHDPGALGTARGEAARNESRTRQVDSTLDDSFPASDPPSWTGVISRVKALS